MAKSLRWTLRRWDFRPLGEDPLGGAPGLYSARYAGSDPERIRQGWLAGTEEGQTPYRSAAFHSALGPWPDPTRTGIVLGKRREVLPGVKRFWWNARRGRTRYGYKNSVRFLRGEKAGLHLYAEIERPSIRSKAGQSQGRRPGCSAPSSPGAAWAIQEASAVDDFRCPKGCCLPPSSGPYSPFTARSVSGP